MAAFLQKTGPSQSVGRSNPVSLGVIFCPHHNLDPNSNTHSP